MPLFKMIKSATDKKKAVEEKWRKAFKPFGTPGVESTNAIAVEVNGIVYDTLTEASRALGRSISWVKRNGKILK